MRLFRSRRSVERSGKSPAVEAALREKRAREHLARKRRHDPRRDEVLKASPVPIPPRAPAPRSALPARPLPRLVVPACSLLSLGIGFVAAVPLFEGFWLPRAPLARVSILGTEIRKPESIARRLLGSAGAPLSAIHRDTVEALVLADPWIESADSFRIPDGTLLVRVVERRAVARHQALPDEAVALVDPSGRRFMGAVEAGGALPLVSGPIDVDASLSATALEILAELSRHRGLAQDPSALTLHLPIASGTIASGTTASRTIASGTAKAGDEPVEGGSGFVLDLGPDGPRVLLGQSFLKRRIARLASLLDQRDDLLAGASVIDLRYADRAVLRTEPTSG